MDEFGKITAEPEALGRGVKCNCVLVGALKLGSDGQPAFDLLCDYHVFAEQRAGEDRVWLTSRPVSERHKYPNWPPKRTPENPQGYSDHDRRRAPNDSNQ